MTHALDKIATLNTALDLVSQLQKTLQFDYRGLELHTSLLHLRNAIFWELKQQEQEYENLQVCGTER